MQQLRCKVCLITFPKMFSCTEWKTETKRKTKAENDNRLNAEIEQREHVRGMLNKL